MGLTWLFFSFQGRIGRAIWWLAVAGTLCLNRVVYYLSRGSEDLSLPMIGGLAVAALHIAPTVKRLHDVGRSGWWFVPYFVLPVILLVMALSTDNGPLYVLTAFAGLMVLLWAIFEMGFIRGPRGPNRYGDDPLE